MKSTEEQGSLCLQSGTWCKNKEAELWDTASLLKEWQNNPDGIPGMPLTSSISLTEISLVPPQGWCLPRCEAHSLGQQWLDLLLLTDRTGGDAIFVLLLTCSEGTAEEQPTENDFVL